MTAQNRRLKVITFTLDGDSFECQLTSWTVDPGVKDGDRVYTYCPDGMFIEDTDNEPTLNLKFVSDWRLDGISDYLWQNEGAVVAFVLDHHPDIVGEHVQWSGNVKLQPAPAGGDRGDTEMQEVTLMIVGDPTYTRVS